MAKRPYITHKVKAIVAERAQFSCEYCRCPKAYAPSPFDVEHIIPLTQGGRSSIENLAYSCKGCNGYKYNFVKAVDPVTGVLSPLFHPRIHQWQEHFTWSNDRLRILGITAIGRATSEKLRLNRQGLINIRKLLQMIGEHPPN